MFLHAAAPEPFTQVLTLADVECLKLMATLYNRFDTNSGNSHATSDRQFAEVKEVQADAPER